jgi:WD40 repeat protein
MAVIFQIPSTGWIVDDKELLVGQLQGHERGVEALAVSPDGWQLVSGSYDATLRFWDLKRRTHVKTIKHGRARIVCVDWSRDGKHVAAGDIFGNVIVCEPESDAFRVLVQLLDGVESLVFVDEDRWLATGDRGGSIQLWPLAKEEDGDYGHGKETYPRWQAHASRVTGLALSADGGHIVSGSRNGRICRWSAHPTACRWTIGGVDHLTYDFAFVDRGTRLVVTGEHKVDLWDLDTRTLLATWAEEQGPWHCAAVSPEFDVLLTGNDEGTIVAWNLDTFEELARWKSPGSVAWERIVFAPVGGKFAAVAWERLGEAWVFDLDDSSKSWQVPARQSKCAAFGPNGNQLAVAWMDDGRLYEWDTQALLMTFHSHSNTLSDLAFSPDGNTLATVSHDRKLRLWDVQTGAEQYAIVAHQDWVRSVGFASDGGSLVTGGDDRRVRLWHTKTGQLLLELPDEGHGILRAQFSPNGRRVVCVTNDHRIVVYDSDPRREPTDVAVGSAGSDQ